MFFWILFTIIIISADCQWVPSGTIPDSVIALSPDGSTAIAHTGIYIQMGSSWTLTQPFTFLNMKGLFLSRDGSAFAISNSTSLGFNIDIFSKTNGIWTVSSIIYGSSLGVDSDAALFPAAVTSDGKTMVVVSYGQTSFGSDIFILVGDGLNFNFQQQLLDLPYLVFHELSYSLDGSTLAMLWRFPSNSELGSPVYIYSRGTDGLYKIVEEHSSFSSWYRFAISSDSQYLIGATSTPDNINQLFFFSRIDYRYQLVQVIDASDLLECSGIEDLSVSLHASFVFFSCQNIETGNDPVVILQQSNQTSWSAVQTLTDSQPSDGDFGLILQSSFDGSTLLSSAYGNPYPSGSITYVYTNSAIPSPSPPQATATTTASATASASSTSSSAASASATSSSSATSTSSSSATHSASISSTGSSSSTQTPSWSASPTNNADNASSLSSFSSPSVTITISVLSTALILFSIAVFVNWLRKYYIQSSSVRLYAGESRSTGTQEEDDGENQRVASGDPLLYRIN
jgi:hypothetical protein